MFKYNINNIKLIVFNIRSLSKHFNELSIFLDSLKNFEPDIIILTETWLTAENLKYYTIEGYIGYIAPRTDGTRSGGVVTYVKQEIEHTNAIFSNQYFQAVQIKLQNKCNGSPNLKQIEVLGLYRNIRKSQKKFIEEIDNVFLKQSSQNLIITGDLNINLLDSHESQHLLNKFSIAGLKSFINEPTRFGVNKNGQNVMTCIDHLYARNVDIDASVVLTSSSDHAVIKATVEFALNQPQGDNVDKQVQFKMITFTNWTKFGEFLANETWNNLDFSSVDNAFDSFIEKYNYYKSQSTEIKQLRIPKNKYKKRAPWLSDKTHQY